MINNKIIIGISVGDINGIGPELIIKTFDNPAMLDICTPVIFGSSKLISFYKKALGSDMQFTGIDKLQQIVPGKINILNIWEDAPEITPGQQTQEGGRLAFSSLDSATQALKGGSIDALVTAPINKKNIQSAEFHFSGHTEYLEEQMAAQGLMFLISDELRVAVATGHIALSEVSNMISPQLLRSKILQMEQSLRVDFGISKPKIAVLGLDPHIGEQGVIGTIDSEVVVPTVAQLFSEGHIVFGPYSSDGFFAAQAYKNFDATLAMYHDQGLIPFKTLAFADGVNYTACLPRVRTSPDHGTAYELAGTGTCDESSMRSAIYRAVDIFNRRMEYAYLTKDPMANAQISSRNTHQNDEDPDIAQMAD